MWGLHLRLSCRQAFQVLLRFVLGSGKHSGDLLQLATIKAKSEALRLRQEFELDKFRSKYRAIQGAGGGSPPPGNREQREKGADDAQQEGSESSEADLSIKTEEAFDEPLKVSCNCTQDYRAPACARFLLLVRSETTRASLHHTMVHNKVGSARPTAI